MKPSDRRITFYFEDEEIDLYILSVIQALPERGRSKRIRGWIRDGMVAAGVIDPSLGTQAMANVRIKKPRKSPTKPLKQIPSQATKPKVKDQITATPAAADLEPVQYQGAPPEKTPTTSSPTPVRPAQVDPKHQGRIPKSLPSNPTIAQDDDLDALGMPAFKPNKTPLDHQPKQDSTKSVIASLMDQF